MHSTSSSGVHLLAVRPVLMTSDVGRSIDFFKTLGFVVAFSDRESDPKYVGLRRDGVEIHLQWSEMAPDDRRDRPVYRLLVSNVDALFSELRERAPDALAPAGTTPWHAPAETPWGTREFHLRDPSGNGLQFYQPAR